MRETVFRRGIGDLLQTCYQYNIEWSLPITSYERNVCFLRHFEFSDIQVLSWSNGDICMPGTFMRSSDQGKY